MPDALLTEHELVLRFHVKAVSPDIAAARLQAGLRATFRPGGKVRWSMEERESAGQEGNHG